MLEIATFKAAMRRLVAGVTIITTETADGERHGLTATAVTSVTAEPPTLLCCVNRAASAALHIAEAGRFGVNVLPLDAIPISQNFSNSDAASERFIGGNWLKLVTGAPILSEALAGFDCRITDKMEVGSHFVFIGAIEAIHLSQADSAPLLYGRGAYGTFAPA